MNTESVKGLGTKDRPWQLRTPSGSSEYQMYRDETANPPALVCLVGKTELRYHLRCIEDLHAMLKAHGDWMLLGSADEQKPAAEGTVEAWGALPKQPCRRLVWSQERVTRPVWHVCAAPDGGARPG